MRCCPREITIHLHSSLAICACCKSIEHIFTYSSILANHDSVAKGDSQAVAKGDKLVASQIRVKLKYPAMPLKLITVRIRHDSRRSCISRVYSMVTVADRADDNLPKIQGACKSLLRIMTRGVYAECEDGHLVTFKAVAHGCLQDDCIYHWME